MPPMIDAALAAPDYRGLYMEPSFSGIQSFYRRRYTKDLRGVELAVAGVPMDSFVTNRPGSRFGPEAVRRASSLMSWDAPWPWKRNPYAELAMADYGDCWLDPGRPDTLHAAVREFGREILKTSGLVAIGGDHYISYPLLEAHAEKHGPLALIHFDAHSDTWKDEPKRLDHGTMFYHAAKEGVVDASRSVQLGMRTNNADDHGYLVLDGAELHRVGPAEAARRVRERVGSGPAYLSFDIDYLDPSCAPGTGTPVCGGFSTWQAREFLLALAGLPIVGADLVEVAPAYDHAQMTALAGATIASDLVCLWLYGNRT